MPEVHTNISFNYSGSQVVFHNPAQVAQPPAAGQTIAPAVKPVGQPTSALTVAGQVPGTSVVFQNPA